MTQTQLTAGPAFQILSETSLSIRGRVFSLKRRHERLPDGTVQNLETTSDHNSRHQQVLEPHELREVTAEMLPEGFGITISQPTSEFKNTVLVEFKNVHSVFNISETIFFDYRDWHFTINLIDFVDLLRDELLEGKAKLSRITISKADTCVYLDCHEVMRPYDDIHKRYLALDEAILRGYRKCIRVLTSPEAANANKTRDESTGLKWWIRYVIVPLVGSGTFAALLAWFIAKGIFG